MSSFQLALDSKSTEPVQAVLRVKEIELRKATSGNPFLSGKLHDKDKEYSVCVWDRVFACENGAWKVGDVIDAEWKVKEFKGEVQLDIAQLHSLTAAKNVTSEQLALFVKVSHITRDIWLKFYNQHARPLIEDNSIEQLIDVAIKEGHPFWQAPAAKGMHHNHVGGLAEHTHTMLKMAIALFNCNHPQMSTCRKSLVIAGVVLHDWAKSLDYEQTEPGVFKITRFGELMGHLAGGPVVLGRLAEKNGIKMPPELFMHLNHVLLAHHGQLEWGSPIEPKTVEALAVHFIDNLDGKLWMAGNTPDMQYKRGLGNIVHLKTDDLQ